MRLLGVIRYLAPLFLEFAIPPDQLSFDFQFILFSKPYNRN